MLPTLNIEGNLVLHSKLHSRGRGCKVGDLVSAVHPMDSSVWVLKRIVGMPGDFVCVDPDPEGEGGGRGMIQVGTSLGGGKTVVGGWGWGWEPDWGLGNVVWGNWG